MGATYFADIPGALIATARVPSHAAATATEQWPIFCAPFACKVRQIDIIPQAAVTGDNTNYTELNLLNKGSAGAGTTEIGNLDLLTGTDLVAFDMKNIPFNATYLTAYVTMAADDVISLQHAKVASGVLVPECQVRIFYQAI